LQWHRSKYCFGVFSAVQSDLGFGQRQADMAALLARMPGIFQHRQSLGMLVFSQQFGGLSQL